MKWCLGFPKWFRHSLPGTWAIRNLVRNFDMVRSQPGWLKTYSISIHGIVKLAKSKKNIKICKFRCFFSSFSSGKRRSRLDMGKTKQKAIRLGGFSSTMYKNNSRDSSKFKDCSPHQFSCILVEKCHAVGYYSYYHRWTESFFQSPILCPQKNHKQKTHVVSTRFVNFKPEKLCMEHPTKK